MKRLLMVPIMKLAWLKPVTHVEVLLGAPPTRCVLRNCTLAMALSDGSNEPISYGVICTRAVGRGKVMHTSYTVELRGGWSVRLPPDHQKECNTH